MPRFAGGGWTFGVKAGSSVLALSIQKDGLVTYGDEEGAEACFGERMSQE